MIQPTIKSCTPADAALVGELVHDLIHELNPQSSNTLADYQQFAAKALAQPTYLAFLLYHGDELAGMVSVNECCATYAGGLFGEIPEFYIKPVFRSRHYGEVLIAHVKHIAHQRSWRVIEVGAPAYPIWARTIAFYKRHGFQEIGPRLNFNVSD